MVWATLALRQPYCRILQPGAFKVCWGNWQSKVTCRCLPGGHIQGHWVVFTLVHGSEGLLVVPHLPCTRQPESFRSTWGSTLKCTGCCVPEVMRIWLCTFWLFSKNYLLFLKCYILIWTHYSQTFSYRDMNNSWQFLNSVNNRFVISETQNQIHPRDSFALIMSPNLTSEYSCRSKSISDWLILQYLLIWVTNQNRCF